MGVTTTFRAATIISAIFITFAKQRSHPASPTTCMGWRWFTQEHPTRPDFAATTGTTYVCTRRYSNISTSVELTSTSATSRTDSTHTAANSGTCSSPT